ncbi:LysR family transcriptional regulator [Jatrophihabitans sp. YIM 134969]
MHGSDDTELRHLEHFLAVAEERNFTRAATRLHIVQSALSVSIRALERDLGARLFDRDTHRVDLTDAGTALVPEARRVLTGVGGARDAVAAVSGGLRGTVRIGIMRSLALVDLAAIFTAFRSARPGVHLELHAAAGGSAELVEKVGQGRLDVAFAAPLRPLPPGLTAHPLAAEPMLLASPRGHRFTVPTTVRLKELAGLPFIDFPPGWGTRAATDLVFAAAGLHREIAVEVADTPTVLHLVDAGFGHAFVPPSTVPAARRRRLRHVTPSPVFTVSLLTPVDGLGAAAHALVDSVLTRHPG